MQFVELHLVDAELHVANRLCHKLLVALEREQLETHAVNLVQLIECETLHIHLRVRLQFSLAAQRVCAALYAHVQIVNVVVAVVNEIASETCLREVFHILRHERIVHIQHITTLALLHFRLVRYFSVRSVILVFILLHVFVHLVDLRLHRHVERIGISCRRLLHSTLLLYRLRYRVVVATAHHHKVRHRRRNLKTVFILHQRYIFTLKTGNASAADITQELYFISYLHFTFLLYSFTFN